MQHIGTEHKVMRQMLYEGYIHEADYIRFLEAKIKIIHNKLSRLRLASAEDEVVVRGKDELLLDEMSQELSEIKLSR